MKTLLLPIFAAMVCLTTFFSSCQKKENTVYNTGNAEFSITVDNTTETTGLS